MADMSAEDLAFLIKIGQVPTATPSTKPTTAKKDEE